MAPSKQKPKGKLKAALVLTAVLFFGFLLGIGFTGLMLPRIIERSLESGKGVVLMTEALQRKVFRKMDLSEIERIHIETELLGLQKDFLEIRADVAPRLIETLEQRMQNITDVLDEEDAVIFEAELAPKLERARELASMRTEDLIKDPQD
ncbi:MAG: hypothetical protein ACPGN3_03360 [Opitutales bacterium]